MTGTPILLVLGMLAATAPQEAPAPRFDQSRFTPPLLEQPVPSERIQPPTVGTSVDATSSGPAADRKREGLTWGALAHRLGGALVGGWLGYVSAQVVRSDWDKESNSSFRDQRSTWAAAGAVVGVVSSHLFGTTRAPARPARAEAPPRDGSYLGEAEIRESQATNAYELIYNTRMQWLVTRGVNSVAESPRGQATGDFQIRVTPGRDKIITYLDGVRLGGIEDMRDIPANVLTSARFLDTREATLRFGGGHAHGAILLSSEVDF